MSNLSSTPRTEILSNIRTYAALVTSTPHPGPSASELATAEARLDQTLDELQSRIAKERAIRDELQAKANSTRSTSRRKASNRGSAPLHSADGPSTNPAMRLRQIHAVTSAYNQLAEREPEVPPPNSSLPALLALQATANDNASVKRSITDTHAELRAARERLEAERRDLKDNQSLQEALRVRVQALRAATNAVKEKPAQRTAEETAQKRLEAAQTQQRTCDAEARQCTRALVRFINERLAPMLAAEELGGPVAGSEPATTEDDVLAGFTAHGRVKKPRSRSTAQDNEAAHARQQRLRQQRITAIWGPGRDNAEDFVDDDDDDSRRSEVEAAAREMRDLVQELLDAVSQPGGNAAPYVRISRDSAAARFLVRANVAVLHRTDSWRIRLQDFGRTAEN
jgi:hypothetical protein